MRPIILVVCVLTAACSGQVSSSPTSPTSAIVAPAQQPPSATSTLAHSQVESTAQLPFRGSFTGRSAGVLNCPPTCPPTTLTVTGNQTGEATHLGHFTATSHDVVDLATARGTGGTFNFTAANGDQLLTSTTGGEDEFTPPNISHVTLVATIVGGTGRFATATGTLTARFTQTIDFATGTASESGSFEGQINLNK
jgi:hypothetical protein